MFPILEPKRNSTFTQLPSLPQVPKPAALLPGGMPGLTSAVSIMSIAEQPDQPLAALLQDTIIFYEDYECEFFGCLLFMPPFVTVLP